MVDKLESVFPNLVIDMRGNRNYTNYTLRGISSGDYYNPSVQVYVDGVPQDTAFFSQQLVNVKQVEVLSGPQGTLYGRNAQGGIINIVTDLPSEEFSGQVSGLYSGYEWHTGMRVAGALSDNGLTASLDLKRRETTGQIDDADTGDKNIDDGTNWFGRLQMVYAAKNSPLDLAFTYQRSDVESHEELYLADANLQSLTFNSLSQGGVNEFDRVIDSYSLNAGYDFELGTLNSVTAYQDRDISLRLIQGFNTPEAQKTFTQEVNFAFDSSDTWSAIVGALYQKTDFQRITPGFPGYFGAAINKLKQQTFALFGEATYALSDTVDITAGLRWSQEDADIDYQSEAPSSITIKDDTSSSDISPKIALGWQISENQRFYAAMTTASKAEGFNHAIALGEFDPTRDILYGEEKSVNGEAGWRGTLLNDMLQARVAIYQINTKDKQAFTGPVGQQYLRNIGDAKSRGIEFESRFFVSKNTTIDFGGTLGRSTYKNAIDPLTGVDYSGNRLTHAPDSSVQLSVEQHLILDVLPDETYLKVAMRHVSETFFDDANSLSQSSYNLVDASMRTTFNNDLNIRLFVNNLSDEIYRTYSYSQGPAGNFSSVSVGRNIGVQVTAQF